MNKFLLAKCRDEHSYQTLLQNIRSRSLSALSFEPTRIRVNAYPATLVVAASFEIEDSGGFRKNYTHTYDRGTFMFDGLPYFENISPEGHWAEQTYGLWKKTHDASSSIFGTWAFAHYDTEIGAKLESDFSGMTPLFMWRCSDYVAFSTRQLLLATLLGKGELNLFSLSWLSGQANLIGAGTPWKGVQHVPPAHVVVLSARRGDIEAAVKPNDFWSRQEQTRLTYEDCCESLVSQSNSAARLPIPPCPFDITGGLDSRLVLAIALQSNLKQKIAYLQTRRPPDFE